jgi:long-chain acyl-CoA synthetase
VIEDANARLGAHQRIRGFTVWPEDDLPRTSTQKVRKGDLIDWLHAHRSEGSAAAGAALAGGEEAAEQTPLEKLVARIEGVDATAIGPEARLEADLGLDSLGRVELLSMIEEELGAYVDDGAVDPEATLAELQVAIDQAAGAKREEGIFGWPLNPVVRAIGLFIQLTIMQLLVAIFYRRRVTGLENLRDLKGPVLFTPNHHLHFDNAILLAALPIGWRWRLSVAAAADPIFTSWWRGFGVAVIANAFPLAREGAVRRSLDLLGARLDRDFSILMYPEGMLTVDGPLQPFKSGVGLVAILGAVPVVPMRLKVHRHSRIDADASATTWRGDVEVIFGKPMRFGPEADPIAATEELRQAVDAL